MLKALAVLLASLPLATIAAETSPREQAVGDAPRRQPVRRREILAVAFHLLGAEQLRAQGRLLVAWTAGRTGATETRHPCEEPRWNHLFAHPV